MLVEPQPPQLRRRVDLAHLLDRQPGIKRVQDAISPRTMIASLSPSKSNRAPGPSPSIRGRIQTWLAQPSTFVAGTLNASSSGAIALPMSITWR
jgi:hypothetical protein